MTRHPCILLALVTAAAAPASADASDPAGTRGPRSPHIDERWDERRPERRPVRRPVAWVARGRGARSRMARSRMARSQIEAQRQQAGRSGASGQQRQDAVEVRIEIDRVRGFDDPRTKTACTLDLVKGERVVMIERGLQGWILVVTPAGHTGWIPASAVAGEAPAVTPEATPAAAPSLRRAAAPPSSRVAASLVATVGAETFALRQADATAIATGALGAIAAAARVHVARQVWAGLAGHAGFSSGVLTYYSPTERSQPMPIRDVVIDASAEAGWGGAWSVAARAGYHHASLDIESARAEPMLAGARISGATVGLGGTAPLGRRVAVAAAIDVMPSGRHAPAEAGVAAATAVRGAWARGTLTVRLPSRLVAALAYRGGAVDAALPDGTSHSDRSHAVTAGVGVTW